MRDELKKRYDYGAWGGRRPDAAQRLLKGYDPWQRDCRDWRREARQQLREAAAWELRRTLWNPLDDPDRRVLIEVRETASAVTARECLLEVLGQNELVRLPEGPTEIGDICFVHPDGQTPAIFWTTANLCISLVSIGVEPTPVLEWASRLHKRTASKPTAVAYDLELRAPVESMAIEKEAPIEVEWPATVTDDGYYAVFSENADLRLTGEEIRARAIHEGPVVVEAFAVEPDRSSRGGRLDLSAQKAPR